MIQRKIKYLISDTDKKGNVRWYVRVKGARKRRLRSDPDSHEFMLEYAEAARDAMAEAQGTKQRPKGEAGSVARLIDDYLESGAFSDLDPGTQERRRRMLEEFRSQYGDKRADRLPRRAMQAITDTWKAKHGPHGANNRLKAVRGLYAWAVRREHVDRDATREVGFFTPQSEGFHTWTPAEIRRFMARWPIGTAPYVAMAVLLCTGGRRGDAYTLGPQNAYRRRDGEERIRFIPSKTGKTSNITVDIPMLPMMREALAAGPTGEVTFIVGQRGNPFKTAASFGVNFKRWCIDAGLPQCAAHGLRKGGATILAESGVTSAQLMAIYGWTKLEMAERYTRKADRSRLSDALSGGFGLDDEEDGDG